MQELYLQLPGCQVSHTEEEGALVVDWNQLLCITRQRPRDGKWLVVVYDLSKSDSLDTAPFEETMALSPDHAIELMCKLAHRLVQQRADDDS